MNTSSKNARSRTQNTIANIITGFFSRVISILLPFAIRTVIIQKFGSQYVGLNSLFASILQVLSVTELGFSSAIIFSMYAPVANNNVDKICEQLNLYKIIYRAVGTIILMFGLGILPFLDHFINGSYPQEINIYWLYLIYLSNTVISYFAYGYKTSVLTVYQRNDILNIIEMLIGCGKGALQITVLIFSNNFYLYTFMLPVFTLISNLMVNALTNWMYPTIKCKKSNTLEGIYAISTQLKGAAIGKVSLICRNAFDSIILSSMFGLTVTALYSNYYYVMSSLTSVLAVILKGMVASVGNSLVLENSEKNEKDHLKFDYYYMLLVGICTICMYSLYQPFMQLWTKGKLILPFSSMVLFCIYFYVNNLAQVRSVYSEASGIWWEFRYFTIGEMFSNFFLNFVLGHYWGINGILIATIITAFISSFIGITIICYHRVFKKSPYIFFIKNILYAGVTFGGCILLSKLTSWVEKETILSLVIKGVICGFIASAYMSFIYYLIPCTRKHIDDVMCILKIKRK